MTKEELSKVKTGTWFTATIAGTKVTGKVIQGMHGPDPKTFLCQDTEEGFKPNGGDTLNFRYSWAFDKDVKNLRILKKKPKGVPPKPPLPLKIDDYFVTINKGHILVGCTEVSNELVRKIAKLLKD